MSVNYDNNRKSNGFMDRIRFGFKSLFTKNANDPRQSAEYDAKHNINNEGGIAGRIKAGFGAIFGNPKNR